jgi:hypothetical protein
VLTAEVTGGRIVALLPTSDSTELAAEGVKTKGVIAVQKQGADGTALQTVRAGRLK